MSDHILFVILCKEYNFYIKLLQTFLDRNKIDYKIICDFPNNINDEKDNCIFFCDNDLIKMGFVNCTHQKYIKNPCSWDKFFYYIKDNVLYDYYVIMEDDVQCSSFEIYKKLIESLKIYKEDLISFYIEPKRIGEWTWQFFNPPFKKQFHSFNPFCRLSKKLVCSVLDFQKQNKVFEYNEIMLASLCVDNNFSYIDISCDNNLNYFFGEFKSRFIEIEDERPSSILRDIKNGKIVHPFRGNEQSFIILNKRVL